MTLTKRYLYLVVFASGLAALGVEITAAHMVQAVYGTSNIVWAGVIGLVLLFLTVGYRIGGRLADHSPHPDLFLRLVCWTGLAIGVAGVLMRLVLRPAATAMAEMRAGPILGAFVAATILVAVPVILLGTLSPFALRLALGPGRRGDRSGVVSGKVYAASTLGSLFGTILPSLVLIPLVGTRITFWLLAALLLLVAAGLALGRISLLAAVAVTGLASLGIEIAANRLMGPVFGDSSVVWAAVIGVNMAALAIGFYSGGKLADWAPDPANLALLLVAAALLTALIPLFAQPALEVADSVIPRSTAGFALVATATAAFFFALPVALVGCAVPFAIRLVLAQSYSAGGTAGTLYGISTLGSLVGAFLPVLALIPVMGTAAALLALGILLSLVGIPPLARQRSGWALVALPLVLAALIPVSQVPLKTTPGQLYETESTYNYIEVVERGRVRFLLLNEGQGIHSVYDPEGHLTRGTWDFFLAAPFFNPDHGSEDVRSLALVGLAAGTISKQYTTAFGPIPIDGIEIDPEIVRAGREFFDMTEPNLRVIVGDGRYELAHSSQRYDVVGIDAYRLPYIPWHLTTREFFQEVGRHLTSRGVVVINVGRTATDRRLVEAMTATLASVFTRVHVMDVPGTFNTVLVATVGDTSADNLVQNLALLGPETHPSLKDALQYAADAVRPTIASDRVFTDDKAPVELLTNQIVIQFILSGEADLLVGALESN